MNETGNLPTHLRLCVGARVMIMYNVDINDIIVNGSLGTVLGIRVSSTNLLNGEILVLFDDPKAGNSRKIKKWSIQGRGSNQS